MRDGDKVILLRKFRGPRCNKFLSEVLSEDYHMNQTATLYQNGRNMKDCGKF